MPETKNRNFKAVVAWLGPGGLGFAYAFIHLFPLTQGNAPSATEVSDGYWLFTGLALVLGAIGMVMGLATSRRNR